jgi:RimJ/RimL family protein N-acetyltransferase
MIAAMSPEDRAYVSPEWLRRLDSPSEHDHQWTFGYTTIRAEDGAVVGYCGFKGPPVAAGVVEIAYTTASAFEGRGYATEAARSLVDIAFTSPSVAAIRAHTSAPSNASTRVLQKVGFACRGEISDPEDGRVWRWELKREMHASAVIANA